MAILLIGTLPGAFPIALARTHLISLWFFSGVSKLVGPGVFALFTHVLLARVGVESSPFLRQVGVYLPGMAEIILALLVLWPRTRRVGAVGALLLHSVILLILSPLVLGYNTAVYPWNIALALSGFAFFAGWSKPLFVEVRPLAKVALGVLLVSPVAYYTGHAHPYLTHVLYSSYVPSASICDEAGTCRSPVVETLSTLNVPFPPEPPLFTRYFRASCAPGESMTTSDPRTHKKESSNCDSN
jgi:hypothetical protein